MIVVGWGKHTLIIAKRTHAEPMTAFAGVALAISFTRFNPSMAELNRKKARSPSLGCWELIVIIDPGGCLEKVVW